MQSLVVENIVKRYGGRRVVDGVSFKVAAGEIVGLLGPNGAGKTTSFRMAVGMVRPDEGRILFDDADITTTPMYLRARRGIGYLSQEPSVFTRLTVEDNILAVLEALGHPRKERAKLTAELLAELGLTKVTKNKAYTLSGGERRRLEITRALATKPALILLDEPFSGVDPKTVSDIQDIVRDLRHRGIGILLTDHNVREALSVTDRAYIIDEGRIMEHGTPGEIVSSTLVRQRYLGEDFSM